VCWPTCVWCVHFAERANCVWCPPRCAGPLCNRCVMHNFYILAVGVLCPAFKCAAPTQCGAPLLWLRQCSWATQTCLRAMCPLKWLWMKSRAVAPCTEACAGSLGNLSGTCIVNWSSHGQLRYCGAELNALLLKCHSSDLPRTEVTVPRSEVAVQTCPGPKSQYPGLRS